MTTMTPKNASTRTSRNKHLTRIWADFGSVKLILKVHTFWRTQIIGSNSFSSLVRVWKTMERGFMVECFHDNREEYIGYTVSNIGFWLSTKRSTFLYFWIFWKALSNLFNFCPNQTLAKKSFPGNYSPFPACPANQTPPRCFSQNATMAITSNYELWNLRLMK